MEKIDLRFKSHLNYQIEARESSNDVPEIGRDDILHINLRSCTFKEFTECMTFARGKYPDLNFSDTSIESIRPSNFSTDSRYDFVEQANSAKNTAITIGNITLFNELQKITMPSKAITTRSSPVLCPLRTLIIMTSKNSHRLLKKSVAVLLVVETTVQSKSLLIFMTVALKTDQSSLSFFIH